MASHLKGLIFSDTGKDTLIVSVGTLINVVAGSAFFILVPRLLGPINFGIFSAVIATGLFLSAIANFGIDTGVLNFAKNSAKSNEVFSIAIKSYIFLGTIAAVLGFILSKPLASFLGQPQIATLLNIAFLFTIISLITNFYVAALQSRKEFVKASIVSIASNMARIIILLISAYFFVVGLYFVTILFFSANIISIFAGTLFLKFDYVSKTDLKIAAFHRYNFWIALSLIVSSIPFDNYLLLKLSGPFQAGLYAASFKILTFAYQFGGNFTRVLAPRLASFDSNQKAKSFSIKSLPFTFAAVLGLFVLILLSHPLTKLLFGKSFIQSGSIMQVLAVGFMFFFAATIPSSLILYYFGKSSISFLITAIRYITFVILLILFIPRLNATGAAYAFSLSEALSFVLMTTYVVFKFKNGYSN